MHKGKNSRPECFLTDVIIQLFILSLGCFGGSSIAQPRHAHCDDSYEKAVAQHKLGTRLSSKTCLFKHFIPNGTPVDYLSLPPFRIIFVSFNSHVAIRRQEKDMKLKDNSNSRLKIQNHRQAIAGIDNYFINNNNIYLLQLGCNQVAVVMLHVYKTWNSLLLNLSREGYMRSM